MEPIVDQLHARFRRFAEVAADFSQGIFETIPSASEREPSRTAEVNVEIARTMFGKWSIEILAILFHTGPVGFEELRRRLGTISPRVLSQKLKTMESQHVVKRSVKPSRPVGVEYNLTERGLTLAKLGEPVFLYLRFCSRKVGNLEQAAKILRPLRTYGVSADLFE